MLTFTKPMRDGGHSDILVIGGGSAGATAAITAARAGRSVTLIERYGFLGGISTQVLDTFYGFYTPGSTAKKVVGGVPDIIVAALMERNMALLRPNTYGAGQGITYDPETLKVVWETLARDSGVRLLYHSLVIDAVTEGGRVRGSSQRTRAG